MRVGTCKGWWLDGGKTNGDEWTCNDVGDRRCVLDVLVLG